MPDLEEQQDLTLGDHLHIVRRAWLFTLVGTFGAGVFTSLPTSQCKASAQ